MATHILLTEAQNQRLHAGARPDEKFYVQVEQPTCSAFGTDFIFRVVSWDIDFKSFIFLWFFRMYIGNEKCDASRTFMWNGMGNPGYVITTTPKEKFSFRVRYKKPDREVWTNMGGI